MVFAFLGDLLRFWRAVEQFSLLGSANRTVEVMQDICARFLGDFNLDMGADSDPDPIWAYSPTRSVRMGVGENDPSVTDLPVKLLACVEEGVVPPLLFASLQAAVEKYLVNGPLFSFLVWRWCPLHGCLGTQCRMLGATCAKSRQGAKGRCEIPANLPGILRAYGAVDADKLILLLHARKRYAPPLPPAAPRTNARTHSHSVPHSRTACSYPTRPPPLCDPHALTLTS